MPPGKLICLGVSRGCPIGLAEGGKSLMTQTERLHWLVAYLLDERDEHLDAQAPAGEGLYRLYRSLVNVRPPAEISDEYLRIEDAYLQGRLQERGIAEACEAESVSGLLLWHGDITRLRTDAIVNAANSQGLGCFVPCHGCIDNAIHTAAGTRLRLADAEELALRSRHGLPSELLTGDAMVTPGFNLPTRYVIHTVGPIVRGAVPNADDRAKLARCYESCLDIAAMRGLPSIAFCCISTGEFHFPRDQAACIAVRTVRTWITRAREEARPVPRVIFDVFDAEDERIYRSALQGS